MFRYSHWQATRREGQYFGLFNLITLNKMRMQMKNILTREASTIIFTTTTSTTRTDDLWLHVVSKGRNIFLYFTSNILLHEGKQEQNLFNATRFLGWHMTRLGDSLSVEMCIEWITLLVIPMRQHSHSTDYM